MVENRKFSHFACIRRHRYENFTIIFRVQILKWWGYHQVKHSKKPFRYLISFSSYLTSNNITTLKSRFRVTQDHWKWHHSTVAFEFLLTFHTNYGPILYHFRYKARYRLQIFHLHSTPPLEGRRAAFLLRNIVIMFDV